MSASTQESKAQMIVARWKRHYSQQKNKKADATTPEGVPYWAVGGLRCPKCLATGGAELRSSSRRYMYPQCESGSTLVPYVESTKTKHVYISYFAVTATRGRSKVSKSRQQSILHTQMREHNVPQSG